MNTRANNVKLQQHALFVQNLPYGRFFMKESFCSDLKLITFQANNIRLQQSALFVQNLPYSNYTINLFQSNTH
ncbi:hypothetical protein AYI69_g1460 [Smittium culicis]|uniref:Uncharacterized protein n=1 Tax=Smittium culicis TaxID=133412 RepID=A0A1R1YQI9_9FUNG|nr:hypothetical protein AYI69_g1460 [Smittium culicis]